MEKKKLLLVAVAVGVVLLIIIGIPLLMIAPRQKPASPLQTSSTNAERDWITAADPAGAQGIQNSSGAAAESQSQRVTFSEPVDAPHVTTLTVPIPETAAVPSTPAVQAQKPSTLKLTPSKSAAPDDSAVVKTPAAVKAAPAAKPATAKTTAKLSTAQSGKATHNNYWVQTGAFSTKIRAEGAKDSLASRGVASIIDNRDIDGKTWYRVRVGPYISETEANYWLALVKSIDGFAESQIRMTQTIQ